MLVADVEHGERLINTDNPAALEALRHRPGHSTGTRRHIENLFVALQSEHFSQFLGQIGADLRSAAIKLRRVLRIMEMSFVPVAMPMFVIVSMLMVVTMFVTVAVTAVVSMFMIARVLMPVFGVMFMTVLMSMVMFVAVLVLVIMLVAVLVMLMFVNVIVLMFVFVFFAHGFTIPSNEIRLILACLYHRYAWQARNLPAKSQVVYSAKLSHKACLLQGKYIIISFPGEPYVSLHGDADARASVRREKVVGGLIVICDSIDGEFNSILRFERRHTSRPVTDYLITLSARTSTFGGIVRPICLAAFRLIISSNFVGCSMGRSAGVLPFRILST